MNNVLSSSVTADSTDNQLWSGQLVAGVSILLYEFSV